MKILFFFIFTLLGSYFGQLPVVQTYEKISQTFGNLIPGSFATPDTHFGQAVLPFADLDGNGVQDIIVGSPGDDDGNNDSGAIYILLLNQSFDVIPGGQIKHSNFFGTFGDFPANFRFGESLSYFGTNQLFTDIIEDTFEVAIGTPSSDNGGENAGGLIIAAFAQGGNLLQETRLDDLANLAGLDLVAGDRFGQEVAVMGDLNSDGFPELLVGAPGQSGTGAVYVVFLGMNGVAISTQRLTPIQGLDPGDQFGHGVTCVGDLNGDGVEDIAVGATGDDDGPGPAGNRGAVYVLFLGVSGTNVSAVAEQKISFLAGGFFYPELPAPGAGINEFLEETDQFGGSLASVDLNSDGISDLLVGTPHDDDGAFVSERGAVWILYLNANGTVFQSQKISSTQGNFMAELDNNDQFGVSVRSFGDFNNDNIPDLLAGAWMDDDGGSNFGAVYFIELRICSDGIVSSFESCDDGNFNDNDGCSQFCAVEAGFTCSLGEPSQCLSTCGDRMITGNEQCDDGNMNSGDGCSLSCQFEIGFVCMSIPSVCSNICGDGVIVAGESCDDGNTINGDGCSQLCETESSDSGPVFSVGQIVGVVVGVSCFIFVLFLILLGAICFLAARPQTVSKAEIRVFEDNEIPVLQDIILQEKLGQGNFGEVLKGQWHSTTVALKSMINQDSMEDCSNEIAIIKDLRHPNVLAFYGVYFHLMETYIVIEYMQHGSLSSFLQIHVEATTKEFAEIAFQAAKGMTYIHSQNILHRDLACRNLLVSGSMNELVIKVADFGLSRSVPDTYTSSSRKIPIRWTAPEAFTNLTFSKKTDVWSYGVVLWEIYARGALPYPGYSNDELVELIPQGKTLKPPVEMPLGVIEIMKSCLSLDAEKRPEFSEVADALNPDSPARQPDKSIVPLESMGEDPGHYSKMRRNPSSRTNTSNVVLYNTKVPSDDTPSFCDLESNPTQLQPNIYSQVVKKGVYLETQLQTKEEEIEELKKEIQKLKKKNKKLKNKKTP